ncbi:sensor histidine kinase [Streptococcus uberis]|nr:sensor histidine kinase [Streptococcus uberis]MCK1255823.1 sensor histidine kinase [Streptococcus uberis]
MHGNKEQIYRLLENLLLNACYHNEKGSKVSISSKVDKKTIYLWVSDNGKKLEASSLDEITKPFYKNDKARTAKANSNFGLGLAIVKTIVD